MKTIVVGAGIVGTSLAYSLLQRGHQVALIEGKEPASGTTGTSYAWINSHKKHPEAYHAINFEGLRHWTRTVAPQRPGVVELNGHVEFAQNEEHRTTLTQRLNRLQSLDYEARWITRDQARRLVPMQVPEDAIVAWFPWEGHAYPSAMVEELLQEMHSDELFALHLSAVTDIDDSGDAVQLESGRRLEADRVLLAVGNSTTDVAALAGVHIPMIPNDVGGAVYGYLGYADAKDHGLRGPVTTDKLNIRPNGPNGLILQALDLDSTADPEQGAPAKIGEHLLTRARVLLPDHEINLAEVRVGYRVIPGDGLTVAGPAHGPNDDALWIAVTHSGVVLAPWLSEALAEEITTGMQNPLLEDFRPARFADKAQLPEYAAPRRAGDQ